MSKQIRTVLGCSIALLVVGLLLVTFGHKMRTVAAGPQAASQGSGAAPCDTTKSGAPSELCGKSTDPAHWWDAAGITGGNDAEWHTQPTFIPPDVAYTHYAIPKGDEKYAVLSGSRIKGYINDITGISRKSRDDGNQYWGRITGSEYDHMTTDYVAAQLKRVGVQNVHLEKFNMPPQWWPTHWDVSVTGGGKTVKLESAWPHASQPLSLKGKLAHGTDGKTWDLQPVWVGLGTPADFDGRDVKGKAVLIYSVPTPGGQDYSSGWSGAVQRAWDGGAAVVFTILGIPGNHVNHGGGAPVSEKPTFALGMDDATAIREMMEKKQSPVVHVNLTVENRENLTTNSVIGTLPGMMSDEYIVIMAHTEAPMQGAMDNASGIGTMIELAQYYASLPKEQRKRTITFLTSSGHHTPMPDGGLSLLKKEMKPMFDKTALVVNCEHTASMLYFDIGSNLVGSNAIAPRRWYFQGSDDLKALITKTFVEYGVATYSRPANGSGGELSKLRGMAPGFHVLNDWFYHTDLDIPNAVPVAGLESVVRAYAKIIDETNKMPLDALRQNMGEPVSGDQGGGQ